MNNNSFPTNKIDALAFLYVQTHIQNSMSAQEVAEMYLRAWKEIKEYLNEHTEPAKLNSIQGII